MFKLFSRNAANVPSIEKLIADQNELKKQLDWIEEEINRLTMKHDKLSGRFYARFGKGSDQDATHPAPPSSKDDLRRMVGIRAGHPAPHT